MLAILSGGMFIFFILILLFIIIEIIASWKMFKKAGKNGWESIVPFYSSYVLTEIAGLNWWWFLFLIINTKFEYKFDNITLGISLFGFLGNFNCYYNIARRFGKDKTTAIFAGIFPYIFVLIFGFSRNEIYDCDIAVGVNGIFSSDDIVYNNCSRNSCNLDNQSTDTVDKECSNIDDNFKKEYSFCGNCGKKLNNKDKYCSNCGRKKDIK